MAGRTFRALHVAFYSVVMLRILREHPHDFD